jgi:predicted metalloprotease
VQTTEDLPAPEFPLDAERDDLTSFWSQQFSAWERDPYVAPSYVSFTSRQITGCGPVNPLDVGWFYCSSDNGLFMDVAAAEDLEARYGRSINVFLLAHETGHHVETLLGYVPCSLSECLSETGEVQYELMADCFAGAWMANAADRGVLSEKEIEDILVAVADSFSDPLHGSSALRLWWLLQGFHIGTDVCFQPVTQQ